MKLTQNFTLNELVYSETATSHNIDNRPSVPVISNLQALCTNILQPLRDALGCPIVITSGFRCAELNKRIGGAANSQHLYGQAADFIVPQKDLKEVFKFIKAKLPYDQLLYEYNKTDRWIHVSYRTDGKNRKQAIDNYKA